MDNKSICGDSIAGYCDMVGDFPLCHAPINDGTQKVMVVELM
jgi:hypothetical protein